MDSKDRIKVEGGKVFIPLNIDGGYNDSFNVFSSGKIYGLGAIVIGFVVLAFMLNASYIGLGVQLIFYLAYWVVGIWVIRRFIINEKYYYKVISRMQEYECTTPAVFWGISDIVNGKGGAILQYTDGKVGIIVRLNKNIITGKNASDRDTHYNSLSDFYGDILSKDYKFVQFNKMETLGKDARLQELDKLVYNTDNINLKKLMELQVGYLKVNARETLYETDYILIYTNKILKRDSILDDIGDSLEILTMGSNYSTYDILDRVEVIDLVNSEYGTKRFDYLSATMSVFKNNNNRNLLKEPIKITDIEVSDGNIISLSDTDISKIKREVIEYNINKGEYKDIRDILGRLGSNVDKGIDTVGDNIDIDDGLFMDLEVEYGLGDNIEDSIKVGSNSTVDSSNEGSSNNGVDIADVLEELEDVVVEYEEEEEIELD